MPRTAWKAHRRVPPYPQCRFLKFTLLPSSGTRRTLQGHVGPGNMKLSSHSLGPPPDTTQGWGDPSPDPPPRQTAPASPLPVPPSNPLGQAGPSPDECQTGPSESSEDNGWDGGDGNLDAVGE
ncbi:hypothetical protein H2248_006195 [Termitomyces sp. 'cryptogamus']|nr:hypothetical protein H2248_006195 [Termitomyces sp. 'cryptogamus']